MDKPEAALWGSDWSVAWGTSERRAKFSVGAHPSDTAGDTCILLRASFRVHGGQAFILHAMKLLPHSRQKSRIRQKSPFKPFVTHEVNKEKNYKL